MNVDERGESQRIPGEYNRKLSAADSAIAAAVVEAKLGVERAFLGLEAVFQAQLAEMLCSPGYGEMAEEIVQARRDIDERATTVTRILETRAHQLESGS